MLDLLKSEISKNKEINNELKYCNDEFLLRNQSIIFTALDTEHIKDGYKIKVSVVDDKLEWEYVPIKESTKKYENISLIRNKYKYKLPDDWSKYYLLDPNDINWTEDKRELAYEFKSLIDAVEKKIKRKGFWLWGYCNTGKTFATISLLNYFTKINKTVSFVNIPELISTTQKSMGNLTSSTTDYIDMINKSDVVVIDDLGSERPTPWFKENILLPIVDYRMKSEKITIFNSNLSISKYENKLKYRSQNPETEEETNNKLISRINELVGKEIKIG